jgi:hypothetical protein
MMMRARVVLFVLLATSGLAPDVRADVWIRWDQNDVPPPAVLGISRIVIPAENRRAIERAASQGYDVYLEQAPGPRLVQLQPKSNAAKARVLSIDARGKWPHIRSNTVTRRNEVLQVAGRTAQPWIETNAALFRILRATHADDPPVVTYTWKPITVAEDEGPALENYLVAIAEAGSFGGDLLLPLQARFENDLLLGKPQARAAWKEIRRYLEFYSWPVASRYKEIANVAVVTADPMPSFELMNLLARHNVPFELLDPARVPARGLASFKLVIATDPSIGQSEPLAAFARSGGTLVTRPQVGDPNQFALEMRQKLGADNRPIDIWNGITVVTAPYEAPDGTGVLVTLVNYAHQPLPVQMRVRGKFAQVHYESPEQEATLLPYEHRNGFTEFVLPALRTGGRLFLTPDTAGQ